MNFPLPDIWGNAMLKGFGTIVMPEDIAWWPIQPGWWVLLSLILLAFGVYLYRRYRHWKRNTYRRQALNQLSSMHSLREMNAILKHAAASAFPEESSTELWGNGWITYLNSKTTAPCFLDEDEEKFNSLLTQPEKDWPADITQLQQHARNWLEQHMEAKL